MARADLLGVTLLCLSCIPAELPRGEAGTATSKPLTPGDVDYARVERKIVREPRYVAKPLYALFLFGPKASVKVWAVLDKSKPTLGYYDVLYFDKDADGDLTDHGERFTGTYNERGARAGMALTIPVGDYRVPGTDRVHKKLRFSTIRKTGRKGIWFTMLWCGKEVISGGASATGMDSTIYGPTPDKAPVLRPTAEGPISFALWGSERTPVLSIGASTSITFQIGNRGSGSDTLCYLSCEFLKIPEDRIIATLIAKDRSGNEVRTENEILKPC
jgi:hypothetical protein